MDDEVEEKQEAQVEALSPERSKALLNRWKRRVEDSLKREKKFRETAKTCVKVYEGDATIDTPFNILYSNVETLAPAVYNARPIPMVDRRFKDADPVGKAAAEVSTRTLKFLVEAEDENYDSFDESMQAAVLDGLLTNRGVTRFKYTADTSNGDVASECVFGETVRYDKFCHGFARTWKKVPWICFEHDMTGDEIEKNFQIPEEKLNFNDGDNTSDKSASDLDKKEEMTGVKLAKVYECWDKESRQIVFWSPNYADGVLKTSPDTMKLQGFFPVPKPLNFMRKTSTLVPTPLYVQYKEQVLELNAITQRIKHLIKSLKVRGFYNGTIEKIETLLVAEDNTFLAADNVQALGENPNVSNLLWLVPLDQIMPVIQQLYSQREQIKQVIYEITGISDILRGSSVASETATAQNIKNQWGTLRLKKMQKEVQRYCRDCLRIMLEMGVTSFQPDTVKKMTGLEFPAAADKQKAQMQMQMQQAQARFAPPQMGPDGQPIPPQPPQPDPAVQKLLATPAWEEILGLLQNDQLRSYRVDIETNSTIDAEAAQDKQDISELLNALSQFLNGIAPLIEKGVMPFEVAKNMLLAIARRYTFGPQVEESLMQMAEPPQQGGPSPEDQIKLQMLQAKAENDQKKAELDLQKAQQQAQLDAAELQGKLQLMQAEMEIKQQELQLKREEMMLQASMLRQKAEFGQHQHSLKMEAAKQKAKEPANATV